LIAKALKPIAKIKKKAWKNMGNAFGQIRKSVGPMQSFSKILEVVNVLMLPLTYVMTILAMVIAKSLLPYLGDVIKLMDQIGISASGTDDLNDSLCRMIDDVFPGLIDWVDKWANAIYNASLAGWAVWLSWDAIVKEWQTFADDILSFIEDLVNLVPGGGGGGGGDGSNDEAIPIDFGPTPYIPMASSSSTSNSVIINLQGSINDDRDKLIRDIVEQVVIRL